jgi:hypothetical protein
MGKLHDEHTSFVSVHIWLHKSTSLSTTGLLFFAHCCLCQLSITCSIAETTHKGEAYSSYNKNKTRTPRLQSLFAIWHRLDHRKHDVVRNFPVCRKKTINLDMPNRTCLQRNAHPLNHSQSLMSIGPMHKFKKQLCSATF